MVFAKHLLAAKGDLLEAQARAVSGGCVVRGKIVETEEIPAYCAVAHAGLGWLADTLMTRSVVIRMRPRAPGEQIEPYRQRLHAGDGMALRARLESWAIKALDLVPASPIGGARPTGPPLPAR